MIKGYLSAYRYDGVIRPITTTGLAYEKYSRTILHAVIDLEQYCVEPVVYRYVNCSWTDKGWTTNYKTAYHHTQQWFSTHLDAMNDLDARLLEAGWMFVDEERFREKLMLLL